MGDLAERLHELPPDAEELGAELVGLYGEGLERIFAALDEETVARLAADEVVAGLMLAHGLYPVSLESGSATRSTACGRTWSPTAATSSCSASRTASRSCGSAGRAAAAAASQTTMEHAIEAALQEHAPDLLGIDVEGVVASAPRRPKPEPDAEWVELAGVEGLQRGAVTGTDAGLIVANVAGTLLAYHDRCAGCSSPLADAMLLGGTLACAHCGARFDLPRAGRDADGGPLQLEPVPLLRNGGPVRVALPPRTSKATCELCPLGIGENHRHLLHLVERRIICVCETCWSTALGRPRVPPARLPDARARRLRPERRGCGRGSASRSA